MSMQKTTLPIKYWDSGQTRRVCPVDKNHRILEVAYFDQVRFVGLSKHYPQPLIWSVSNKQLILPTIEKFMSLGRGTVYEETMEYEMWLPVRFTQFCNLPVFYFVYNMANYYHFIYDTLPYLYHFFNERKIHPNMKLLVSPPEGEDDLYPFVWECLHLMGITENDVVFLNQNTLYNKVCV